MQQFVMQNLIRDVMFMEEFVVFVCFYQFDEMQLDRVMLDLVQKGVELVMINIMYQYGIDFDFFKIGFKCSINFCYDLVEFILFGNSVKLVGVQIVDIDVNVSKFCIVLVCYIVFQMVIIGCDCNLVDSVVFLYSGDDIGKVAV